VDTHYLIRQKIHLRVILENYTNEWLRNSIPPTKSYNSCVAIKGILNRQQEGIWRMYNLL